MNIKVNRKYILIIFTLALNVSLLFSSSYRLVFADRLSDTNKTLENKININPDVNTEEFFNIASENAKNSSGEYKGRTIIDNLKIFLVKFIVNSRVYAVYIYVLAMMINIILLAYMSAKSVDLRRKYVMRGVYGTITLLIVLNIPIAIIYFQNRTRMYSANEFFNILVTIIDFLQSNALIISALVFIMGVLTSISSDGDIRNIMKSKYYKKLSLVLFIALTVIPIAVKIFI